MRFRLEYALIWCVVKSIGVLPRPLARAVGIAVGQLVYLFHGKLRRVGQRNLAIAFPEIPAAQRSKILHGVFTSLGRQLAEVCLFPRYTAQNVSEVVVYEGFENFERAFARGKGVLFLTGHLGGWELSAFAHSLYGHPLSFIMRPLDNPYLDRMMREYRTLHGNKTIDKDDIRKLLRILKAGETAGVLMDTNMTPPQGIFVPYFGRLACTASSVARIALHADAAVIPGFTVWDAALGKYKLRFDPAVTLIRSGDLEADIEANTQRFTKIIEDLVRQYPDQWLWVHRRWKTRPPGEPPIY